MKKNQRCLWMVMTLLFFFLSGSIYRPVQVHSVQKDAHRPARYLMQDKSPIRFLQPVFDTVNIERDMIYRKVMDRRGMELHLKLDLYEPAGDSLNKRPLILWIHGGGFRAGSKERMADRCEAFARFGYVTASISYRLSRNHTEALTDAIEDAVTDARIAIDFLRQNAEKYRIDTQQIFLGGSSAGGITALHLGIEDKTWDKTGIKGIINLWGAFFGSEEEIDPNDPPVLIIHGEKDQVVPFQLSVWLKTQLEKQGVMVWFYSFANVGHGVKSKGPYPFHYQEALFIYSLIE